MRFEYLIGMRYLRARRRERFVSLIALISLAGVMLGTFTLTVTLAVMSGLQEDLRDRLLAFNPHITVEREDGGLGDLSMLQKRIAAMPEVVAIAPFLSSQVLAVSDSANGVPGYVTGGMVRAVPPHGSAVLGNLRRALSAGGLDALGGRYVVPVTERGSKRQVALPGAIVGKSLAADLGITLGMPLTLISPASLGAGAGLPRLRRFVVGGFFQSGMEQYDGSLIFVALDDARALLADDPGQVESGLEVRVREPFDAPAVAARIGALAGNRFEVTDWTRANAPLFSALKLEKLGYFVVLLLIVLVAAFNIVATLVMVVMERRKEIAILQAMGARPGSIAAIFISEGAILGVVGTALGVGAGLIASFLIGKYHLIHLPPEEFIVSSLPVRIYAGNFAAVAAAAIALCLAAALYPALQARRLQPVEVIRYE